MNSNNQLIKKYIQRNLKGKDRFTHICFSTSHKGLDFSFENVGNTFISLLCGSTPMSYNLDTSYIGCGCGGGDCNHKEILRSYFSEVLLK